LEYTDIGRTKITVSTVGVINDLKKIIDDPDWPAVKIALSLHALDYEARKILVPSTQIDFFEKFKDWAKVYLEKFGRRKVFLTFEYVLVSKKNDSLVDAMKLSEFAQKCGVKKVNLINYNEVADLKLKRSDSKNVLAFKNELLKRGIDVTMRRSLGKDIKAACGQLAGKI